MNKLSYLFLLFAGLAITFAGCNSDDENPVGGSTITVPGTAVSIATDGSADITFTVNVPSGYQSASASADVGTTSISSEPSAGATSGSIVVRYTAPSDEGTATITLTVTDANGSSVTNTAAMEIDAEAAPVVEVLASTDGVGTVTWTKDNIYLLSGFIYVNNGQTLTIEPGSIIKGKSGEGAESSALIVARGGKIIAEGTANEPIIFTSEADEIQPGEIVGSIPVTTRGLWGGIIILGSASLNTAPNVQQIEGIPTTEPRGEYGGTADDDNSGILRYVSIRHGGTEIGEGNEINGLTMGGVGSGTTIDFVEVIANLDDGFEWFGGTVNTSHLISAYCGDDAMDYDQGWRGNNQFWFVFQDAEGDRGGEHDGGTSPETGTPFATPKIFNGTFVGGGDNRALTLRDNAGGEYHNSIFTNYGKGIDVEDLDATDGDSYNQFKIGNLKFQNLLFFDVRDDMVDNIVLRLDYSVDTNPALEGIQPMEETLIGDAAVGTNISGIQVADPVFDTVFLPSASDEVTMNVSDKPADAHFVDAAYKGAFEPAGTAWHAGWSLWANQ